MRERNCPMDGFHHPSVIVTHDIFPPSKTLLVCSCGQVKDEREIDNCDQCSDIICHDCYVECFDCGEKICLNCAESRFQCIKCSHKKRVQRKAFVVLGNKDIPVKNSEYFINKIQSLGVNEPMKMMVDGKEWFMKIPVWHMRQSNNSILDYYVYMEE